MKMETEERVRGQIKEDWWNAKYPFDTATCGKCLTQHACGMCHNKGHAALIKAAQTNKNKLLLSNAEDKNLYTPAFKAAALKLRKRFARFFAAAPAAKVQS